MTETQWLACDEPPLMLDFLRDTESSGRKLRLFTVGCCRRIWPLLTDPRSRQAVDVGERWADCLASEEERRTAAGRAKAARDKAVSAAADAARFVAESNGPVAVSRGEWGIAIETSICAACAAAREFPFKGAGYETALRSERRAQSELLREIVGNPFRLPRIDPSWLSWAGGTVVALARSLYEEGRFTELPVLADALEEAGCVNEEILSHCRSGAHVRGCWVVDMLLAKA